MQCVGPSMLPTVQPRGDVLLHEKASVMLQRVRVGARLAMLLRQQAKPQRCGHNCHARILPALPAF